MQRQIANGHIQNPSWRLLILLRRLDSILIQVQRTRTASAVTCVENNWQNGQRTTILSKSTSRNAGKSVLGRMLDVVCVQRWIRTVGECLIFEFHVSNMNSTVGSSLLTRIGCLPPKLWKNVAWTLFCLGMDGVMMSRETTEHHPRRYVMDKCIWTFSNLPYRWPKPDLFTRLRNRMMTPLSVFTVGYLYLAGTRRMIQREDIRQTTLSESDVLHTARSTVNVSRNPVTPAPCFLILSSCHLLSRHPNPILDPNRNPVTST